MDQLYILLEFNVEWKRDVDGGRELFKDLW